MADRFQVRDATGSADESQTSPFVIESMTDEQVIDWLVRVVNGLEPEQVIGVEKRDRANDIEPLFVVTTTTPPRSFHPEIRRLLRSLDGIREHLSAMPTDGSVILIRRRAGLGDSTDLRYEVGYPEPGID